MELLSSYPPALQHACYSLIDSGNVRRNRQTIYQTCNMSDWSLKYFPVCHSAPEYSALAEYQALEQPGA